MSEIYLKSPHQSQRVLRILIVKKIEDPEKLKAVLSSQDIPYETILEYLEDDLNEINRGLNYKYGDDITFCPQFTQNCYRGKLIHKIKHREFVCENEVTAGVYFTTGLVFEGKME